MRFESLAPGRFAAGQAQLLEAEQERHDQRIANREAALAPPAAVVPLGGGCARHRPLLFEKTASTQKADGHNKAHLQEFGLS
jgi:hypothetical protein